MVRIKHIPGWAFTTDYLARDRADHGPDRRRGVLVDRGFFWHVPRPMVWCRIRGHVPVADGTELTGGQVRPSHMWVACDRCGLRPVPQGVLDPAVWSVGHGAETAVLAAPGCPGVITSAGPFPVSEEGVIGGELIIGRTMAGVSVKVGHAGSDHTLAAHVGVGLAGLYLHTERFGTWLQRRLVPRGYESMVTEAAILNGALHWRVWQPRDGGRGDAPWWRDARVPLDPRDVIWGPPRYSYRDTAGPAMVAVHAGPGETYQVTMVLQRQWFGRPGRKPRASWSVRCDSAAPIPYGNARGDGMMGWAVELTGHQASSGNWAGYAALASSAKIAGMRLDRGMVPMVPLEDC